MRRKKMMTKKEVTELIRKANKELMSMEIFPLEMRDGGWRYWIPAPEIDNVLDEVGDYLEKMPALRKIIDLAVYDLDANGAYYWIQYSEPPSGVTTPAMRFMALK